MKSTTRPTLGGLLRSLSGLARPAKPEAERLRQQLIALFRNHPKNLYTPQQLYLSVRPSSPELMSVVLDELAREGVVRRIFRVESPRSHNGIGDFASITDIPPRIYDKNVEEEIEVEPSLIRPIFKTA